ncbi:MAG TPA: hypothetical protein VHC71_16470 [Hyphomicrobium sp.]|nr:hypothetical protein [Hyphomicrobium sp.]
MRTLFAASAIALFCATAPAIADTNTGPSTPQAPVTPNGRDVTPNPQNSKGNEPQPTQPPKASPGTGSAASGDSAGTTGISGPYNPTPPATNSGSAAQ